MEWFQRSYLAIARLMGKETLKVKQQWKRSQTFPFQFSDFHDKSFCFCFPFSSEGAQFMEEKCAFEKSETMCSLSSSQINALMSLLASLSCSMRKNQRKTRGKQCRSSSKEIYLKKKRKYQRISKYKCDRVLDE